MNEQTLCIQCSAILATPEQLLKPGQIVVRAGRVVEISSRCQHTADIRLDGFAILPQLINAHTHLEFSSLSQPLPHGNDFTEWIRQVLAWRRDRDTAGDSGLLTAINAGLMQSQAASVALAADIVSPPWKPEFLRSSNPIASSLVDQFSEAWHFWPADLRAQLCQDDYVRLRSLPLLASPKPRVLACVEQLGLTDSRWHSAIEYRDRLIEKFAEAGSEQPWAWALSPHAPYSVHSELLERTIKLAREHRRLTIMHVAESPAERQWLDTATGPVADMLSELGADQHACQPPRLEEILRKLSQAPRSLLIHGNYLNDQELDCISQFGEQISIVYCPRTHRYFQHQPYPWRRMVERGIRVIIGTDSRSTNPDLNLWQDAKAAVEDQPTMSPIQAWRAVSSDAAAVLGVEHDFGTIQPGKLAAFCMVPLPQASRPLNATQLLEFAFQNCSHPIPL